MENGYDWAFEPGFATTVCDIDGNIIYMNKMAQETFSKYGDNLIGRNLSEFHGERAISMIEKMLLTGEKNAYTIDKNNQKKLIYQTPWYNDGKIAGLVELSIVIPSDMPHFIR